MPDIGVKITLQGEAQYRNALKQINSDQRVLEAQMKLVKEQFDGQEKSIENLSTKKALLTGALGDVQAKMDLVREALKRSSDAYGEFDDRTMKLKEQFFNLATEEQKLNNQIDATKEQIKSLSQQMADQKAIDDYKKAIEGETGAIEDADRADEELEAEMKLLDAQMDTSGGAADTLKEKQINLAKQVENQEKKVDAMRSALEKAEGKFGKNSEQAHEWRIKLYEAETQLTKTKDELGKTGSKLDEFGEKLAGKTGWGDALGNLTEQFGIHLPNGIKNAINSLGEFDTAGAITIGGIGAVAGAIIAAEKALYGLTKDRAEQADSLNTLADKTGLTTDEIQEYNFAAKRMDFETSTITTALSQLTRQMDAAKFGTEKALYAFAQMGVAFDDGEGNLRDVHDVFWELIEALGNMENRTEADGLAMDLLGRKAQDLNPLILNGRDTFEALAQEAHDMGYVMSVEDVAALVSLSDELDVFDKKLDTIKNRLAIDFSESMKSALEKLGGFFENAGKALADSGIADMLGFILDDVTGLLGESDEMKKTAGDLNTSLQPLVETVALLANAVGVIGSVVDIYTLATNPSAYIKNIGEQVTNGVYARTINANELRNQRAIFNQMLEQGKLEGVGGQAVKPIEDPFDNSVVFKNLQGNSTADEYLAGLGIDVQEEKAKKEAAKAEEAAAEAIVGAGMSLRDQMNAAASAPFADEIADEVASRVLPPLKRITDPDMTAYNAIGSHLWRGGWTRVGENGPEDVKLPAGAEIHTAQDSRRGGDTVIYVTIDAKNVREFNDVVRAAENARMELRRRTG